MSNKFERYKVSADKSSLWIYDCVTKKETSIIELDHPESVEISIISDLHKYCRLLNEDDQLYCSMVSNYIETGSNLVVFLTAFNMVAIETDQYGRFKKH